MDFQDNSKPIYLQMADALCDEILSGNLRDGDKIPSVREYAAELGVNPNTVVRAYDALSSSGVIYQKRGLGYYISDGAKDKVTGTLREKFMRESLPQIRRMMSLLGISPEEAFGDTTKATEP